MSEPIWFLTKDAEYYIAQLLAENERLLEALCAAEAAMSIVEPRTDKEKYLQVLSDIRATLPQGEKT